MTATTEVHHAAPRCLLRLHDETNGSFPDREISPAWLEWTDEAGRWGVPVDLAREDLERLIEFSTEILDREKHRLLHASDWRRWGRRGGLRTLQLYGRPWFSLLALRRWNKLSPAELAAAREQRAGVVG